MRVRERIRSGEEEKGWPRIVKLEGCTSCGSCGQGHGANDMDMHLELADVMQT